MTRHLPKQHFILFYNGHNARQRKGIGAASSLADVGEAAFLSQVQIGIHWFDMDAHWKESAGSRGVQTESTGPMHAARRCEALSLRF